MAREVSPALLDLLGLIVPTGIPNSRHGIYRLRALYLFLAGGQNPRFRPFKWSKSAWARFNALFNDFLSRLRREKQQRY